MTALGHGRQTSWAANGSFVSNFPFGAASGRSGIGADLPLLGWSTSAEGASGFRRPEIVGHDA